jgi:hypothetical protein
VTPERIHVRPDMNWPRRRTVCLNCRTLQPNATACRAAPRHRVVDLDAKAGRDALLTRVWGDPSVRARIRTAAKVSGTGGATGGVLDACGACDGCGAADVGGGLGEIIAAVLVVAAVFLVGYVLFLGARALWRWWRRPPPPSPRGADADGLRLGSATGRTGTVVATTTALSGVSNEACVAFAVEAVAVHREREQVVLRDAATVGFEVALDDGTRVRIPAGAIVLPVAAAERRSVDARFTAYVDEVDPLRHGVDDLDPFAATHVREIVLRPSDRVEVRGALRRLPGDAGGGPAYRSDGGGLLEPAEVPLVVPL